MLTFDQLDDLDAQNSPVLQANHTRIGERPRRPSDDSRDQDEKVQMNEKSHFPMALQPLAFKLSVSVASLQGLSSQRCELA
jgi:hypothetical protein